MTDRTTFSLSQAPMDARTPQVVCRAPRCSIPVLSGWVSGGLSPFVYRFLPSLWLPGAHTTHGRAAAAVGSRYHASRELILGCQSGCSPRSGRAGALVIYRYKFRFGADHGSQRRNAWSGFVFKSCSMNQNCVKTLELPVLGGFGPPQKRGAYSQKLIPLDFQKLNPSSHSRHSAAFHSVTNVVLTSRNLCSWT